AFLCDSLYLCGITAKPPHRDITKTAIGAENSVNWIYSQSAMDVVLSLKEQGFLVYAVEQTSDSVMLQNMQFNQTPVAFVFGNEIDGVDEAVIKACDGVIEIPQLGTKHSFNISVSCGMLLWEYARTRV
ncbi:MAG: RNA methyltransferase, partial [Bacteroidetes bacterium]|nr:RNA methyltransferase [Bacteroidota bacterium]